MSLPTLKPCPFCGAKAVINRYQSRTAVNCENPDCFAQQKASNADESKIFAAWNNCAQLAVARIQGDEKTIEDLRAQLSAFRTQTAQDIKNFMSEIRELKAERDALAKAADALCKRMRVIHDDPLYQSIWACALNHGVSYATGPTYTEELKALESVLRGGE